MVRLLGIGLFLLLATTATTAFYAYSNLRVEFKGVQSVSPHLKLDPGSLLQGLSALLDTDPAEIVRSIVKEIEVSGEVAIQNESRVPVYVPAMSHDLFIEGARIHKPIETRGFRLQPGNTQLEGVSVFIGVDELPDLALRTLYAGGKVSFVLESRLGIAPFIVLKKTGFTVSVTGAVKERVGSVLGSILSR